jgi:cellulose 1,4-beta-cellobiosidase
MTITATSIGLSWSAPVSGGSIAAYTVLSRITGSGQPFTTLADGLTATSYSATGLAPTTSYDFAVYARNTAGPGVLSGIVTQSTLGAVPQAATAINATAGAPTYSSANVTWTAPAVGGVYGPATGYHTYYSAHQIGDVGRVWISNGDTTATSIAFTGLSHNSAYDFLIVPFNTAGACPTNNTYSNFVTDYAPPNAPNITSVAPVGDGTTSKLAATWSAPATDGTHDAATGYNLRYSVHSAGSWTTVTGVTSGAVITGLTAGTSYDVEVQATNGSTTSPGAWSSITTASTYSTALAFGNGGQVGGSLPPYSPVSRSGGWSGGGLNFIASSPLTHPSGQTGWIVYDTQGITPPSTGNGNGTSMIAIGTSEYAQYLSPPPSNGTWYVWALLTTSATAGSGTVTAALVSSAITVNS